MTTSRTSLALAGSAAVLVVAGVISHQVLLTPRPGVPAFADRTASPPADTGEEHAADLLPPTAPQGGESQPASPSHAPEAPDYPVEALARQRVRAWAEGPDQVVQPDEVAQPLAEALSVGDSVTTEAPRSARLEGASVEGLRGAPATLFARESEEVMRHRRPDSAQGRDRFARFEPNPVKVVAEEPVSTFSIDVDTASYSFLRASLNEGHLPEKDAVRIEELVNYFPYEYAPPETRGTPFATHVSVMPAPWNDAAQLMHIGIKGYVPERTAVPRANLVFLIDTSGSMDAPNKLPLLVSSFKLLLNALVPEDRIAIVAYAGSAGVVLPPTPVAERAAVLASLERLGAGGSTAGAEGIRQAYRLAEQHWVEGGVNRVILATDGDFNVGITDPRALEDFIARKRSGGVFLSVLGFGMGNYNDALMQRLAQSGNGHAAYIDTLAEARKVLVEEATSTLFPIARDVKIQVEFNPAAISEYRLIGYETRMLAREDFRNDKVDAGEIGAGHSVTAIYEVTPAGSGAERVPPLRYRHQARNQDRTESRDETRIQAHTQHQAEDGGTEPDFGDELAFVKIRYKLPDAETSTLTTHAVTMADAVQSVEAAPREVRFAAAVAAFGQILRGGRYTGDYSYDDVIALARNARGEDPFGYRNELVGLVRLARELTDLGR